MVDDEDVLERLATALDDLRLQIKSLEQRIATLEHDIVEEPYVGDDWWLIRDAASPHLREAVQLYATCRAGEWSHPHGDPVIRDSQLDAAVLALAASPEEFIENSGPIMHNAKSLQ